MSAKHSVELNDQNFQDVVLKSKVPVLVDCWATWCGPCVAIAPTIEELAQEFQGKAIVAKLDVDNNPQTAMAYRVMQIPTLLVFKDGQIVDKQVGAVPKSVLKGKLEKQLA
jgi:thioredoxin 1